MSYILNETPTGLVDGANTSYTTADTLYQAVVITVDGVIYTGSVTFAANVFTLGDAPTASITISYYNSATSSPSAGSLLVSDVYAAFGRLKRDISDVGDTTFFDWCDWVNKFAYRHIKGADTPQLITETTINSRIGQEWEYLPSDFRDIAGFECGLYQVNNGVPNNRSDVLLPYGSGGTGYRIEKDRIYFMPVPTEARTYNLRYVSSEPEIDAMTDSFIAPLDSKYMQYIVNAIDVLYSQWDEEIGMESIADVRFTRLLAELSKNIKQTPDVYALDDFTQSFSCHTNQYR
jgi:hypothetical protein